MKATRPAVRKALEEAGLRVLDPDDWGGGYSVGGATDEVTVTWAPLPGVSSDPHAVVRAVGPLRRTGWGVVRTSALELLVTTCPHDQRTIKWNGGRRWQTCAECGVKIADA